MKAIQFTTHEGEQAVLDESRLRAFRERLQGPVLCPGDAGYDDARQIWNGLIDRKPALIARCTGAADVIEAVRFSREHGVLLSVRGGGHNAAGLAVCEGGLMIDLSPMQGIRVDPEARTVRAEAGATWGALDRETQVFGLATPGGIVSSTGIAGLTLSGGLSWQRRKHGMSIDNLLSADVVVADGRFLQASAQEHPDLFWALRGGGGNFGIVTSFEYALHPLGPDVMFLACLYPLNQMRDVLAAWRDFAATAPDEATVDGLVWGIPPHPAFPKELHGRGVVGVGGMYAGPPDEGAALFEPLRTLGTPVVDLSGIMPYGAVQRAYDPFFPEGSLCYYWKSVYLDSMSDEVIATLAGWAHERSSPRTLLSLRHLQGAISQVPTEATAFGDRSAPFLLSIDTTWADASDADEHIAWTCRFWADMQRFSHGKMYFNFPGLLEEGEDLLRASYGDNYDRLVRLKTKYDPTNVFRMNQNIKPTGV